MASDNTIMLACAAVGSPSFEGVITSKRIVEAVRACGVAPSIERAPTHGPYAFSVAKPKEAERLLAVKLPIMEDDEMFTIAFKITMKESSNVGPTAAAPPPGLPIPAAVASFPAVPAFIPVPTPVPAPVPIVTAQTVGPAPAVGRAFLGHAPTSDDPIGPLEVPVKSPDATAMALAMALARGAQISPYPQPPASSPGPMLSTNAYGLASNAVSSIPSAAAMAPPPAAEPVRPQSYQTAPQSAPAGGAGGSAWSTPSAAAAAGATSTAIGTGDVIVDIPLTGPQTVYFRSVEKAEGKLRSTIKRAGHAFDIRILSSGPGKTTTSVELSTSFAVSMDSRNRAAAVLKAELAAIKSSEPIIVKGVEGTALINDVILRYLCQTAGASLYIPGLNKVKAGMLHANQLYVHHDGSPSSEAIIRLASVAGVQLYSYKPTKEGEGIASIKLTPTLDLHQARDALLALDHPTIRFYEASSNVQPKKKVVVYRQGGQSLEEVKVSTSRPSLSSACSGNSYRLFA
jgi:hypothetical protein